MKTIGLIAGMSWESSELYYRAINEGIRDKLGGLHSAQIVMVSLDFDPIEKLQAQGNWQEAGALLVSAAKKLERAGADAFMICTNTMHKVAAQVERAVSIPLLHIADETGAALQHNGFSCVALLGTAFTMEEDFYKARLIDKFGLQVIVPDSASRDIVHNVIYHELCLGKVNPASKAEYLKIVEGLSERGAEAVILGCTEIGLLIQQDDTDVLLLDTTRLHAQAAAEFLVS